MSCHAIGNVEQRVVLNKEVLLCEEADKVESVTDISSLSSYGDVFMLVKGFYT